MTTTNLQIDQAVPAAGTPNRADTNAVLKSIRDDAESVATHNHDSEYDPLRYAAIAEVAANYTILTSDAKKLIKANSASAIQLTLPSSMTNIGDFFDVINVNDGVVTLSAGTDGINRAGLDSATLRKDEMLRVTYAAATDPKWLAEVLTSGTLAGNQYLAANAAGDAAEARDDLRQYGGSILNVDAGQTVDLDLATPFALDTVEVKLQTTGTLVGTTSLQDDGVAITGFSALTTNTTLNTTTPAVQAVVKGSRLSLDFTFTSGSGNLVYSFTVKRTAN